MAGSCSSPGTLNCGSVPHWHLSPGNPVFDITCIPKHHLHAACRQAASTFYQSSFCICSFFCVCMCVLSPSFEESPGSDSNEYVSFAGVFQSRIWESMNINEHLLFLCQLPHQWHCSLFGILFSFHFLQFSSLFSCGVDGHMLHILHFVFFCSLVVQNCLSELWICGSKGSLKTPPLLNSKTVWFPERESYIPDSEDKSFDLKQQKQRLRLLYFLRLSLKNKHSIIKISMLITGISSLI